MLVVVPTKQAAEIGVCSHSTGCWTAVLWEGTGHGAALLHIRPHRSHKLRCGKVCASLKENRDVEMERMGIVRAKTTKMKLNEAAMSREQDGSSDSHKSVRRKGR